MSKGFLDPSRMLIWAYQSILIFQDIQLIFFSTLQTIWKVLIITENLKVEISYSQVKNCRIFFSN